MQLGGKYEVEEYPEDFDGVFRFTNATDEDFKTLWNNVEYVFPAQKTVPMIIANSSLEEIQSIRKKFAKRLAEREYYKSKDFKKIANGLKDPSFGRNVIQSSVDETLMQEYVDQCLKPLEIGRASIHKLPEEKINVAAKVIGKGSKDGTSFPSVDFTKDFEEETNELLKARSI